MKINDCCDARELPPLHLLPPGEQPLRIIQLKGAMHMKRCELFFLGTLLLLPTVQGICEELPLHAQIDRLLESKRKGEPAQLADDAEFFRRLHLDLAGRIPSVTETRQFLDDQSPDKRVRTIDRLLDSPEYVDRMADQFHVMLMEQRGENTEWKRFLQFSFAENRPWNEMVRDILFPPREDEQRRGAAYFYTQRLTKVGQNPTDYPGLTRDVGRLFLGVDLQCAECHNHLFIDDYKQREFQGLFAVYQNVSIRKEDFPAINEATMKSPLEFRSVFADGQQQTGPRIPFGREFEIPELPPPDEAQRKKRPDPNEPPAFSALELIANGLPAPDSRLFRQNIANRVWFLLLGEGIVEPLDQFHSANPPTHPELLDLLADEFARHNFDLKWLTRQILLSQTWQRSSLRTGDGHMGRGQFLAARQRPLTPRQLLLSTLQATGQLNRLQPTDAEPASEQFVKLQKKFQTAFAPEPKEPTLEYTPSVKQALFLLNDSDVLALLDPQPGNLTARLAELPDESIPDELYLSIFCRHPDNDERKQILDYLHQRADNRPLALRQLAWAMLTSMEFCVNH